MPIVSYEELEAEENGLVAVSPGSGMKLMSIEEADGRPTVAEQSRAQEALSLMGAPEDAVARHVGVDRSDIERRLETSAKARSIARKIRTGALNVATFGVNPAALLNELGPLGAFGDTETAKVFQELSGSKIPEERQSEDDRLRAAMEQEAPILRETNAGIDVAMLRAGSVFVRGLEAIGLADNEIADELNRAAGRVSQVRAEIEPRKVFSMVENAVDSMVTAFSVSAAATALAPSALMAYTGLIGFNGLRAANETFTEGKDAGLKGGKLALTSMNDGLIESGVTAIFGLLGFGGAEKEILRPFLGATKTGIVGALKQLGISGLSEIPEEVAIEILQATNRRFSGIDPNAINSDNWMKIVWDTTLQTLFQFGLTAGGARVLGAVTAKEEGQAPEGEVELEGEILPEEEVAPQAPAPQAPAPEAPATEAPAPEVAPREGTIRIPKEIRTALRDDARRDKLTGLFRKDLEPKVVQALTREADKKGQPLTLMSLDMANFKQLNDLKGPDVGDQALNIFAKAVQSVTRIGGDRPSDVGGISVRAGGDEINVFLRNASPEQAAIVRDRVEAEVQAQLKKAGLDSAGPNAPVFAAGGLTTRVPNDPRTLGQLRTDAAFDMLRRKKAQKEALGVPLTREEVQAGRPQITPEGFTPTEAKLGKEAPQKLTPSQVQAVKRGEKVAKPKRKARPGVPVPIEKVAKTPQQAFRAGEREATRKAQQKLAQVKEDLRTKAKSELAIRKEMADLAQFMLPERMRGKFNKAIANAKTERQLQAVRGRLLKTVQELAKITERKKIETQLEKFKKAKLHSIVDDQFADQIKEIKLINKENLATMPLADMIEFNDQIAQILHMQKQTERMVIGGQAKSLDENATEGRDALQKTGKPAKVRESGKVGLMKQFKDEGNKKPWLLSEEMDGKKGGIFTRAFWDDFVNGRLKQYSIQREAKKFAEERIDFSKIRNWSTLWVSKRKAKKTKFTLESGKKVEIFHDEFLSLLAHADDPETRVLVTKLKIRPRRFLGIFNRFKLTEADLVKIEAMATPQDLKVMRTLKQYVNTKLRDQLNEAHEDLNGFPIATRDNYWRRVRDSKTSFPKKFDLGQYTRTTLESLGMLKERTGQGQADLVIDSIFTEYHNITRQAAIFIGLAKPLRNGQLLLKHPKIATEMAKGFGNQRANYFDDRNNMIIQEAIGYRAGLSVQPISQAVNIVIQNATKGVLSINVPVMIKQWVSSGYILTEGVSKADLLAAMPAGLTMKASKFAKQVDDRMIKHNAMIAMRYEFDATRLVGQLDDKSGSIFNQKKGLLDKGMGGIAAADRSAIRIIWRVSEIETTRNAKSLGIRTNSPEYWAEVTRRSNDLINRTQPSFDIINQSAIGLESRTNPMAKLAASMFMSQRNMMFNMSSVAIGKIVNGIKTKNLKEISAGTGSLGLLWALSPFIMWGVDELRKLTYNNREDKDAYETMMDAMLSVIRADIGLVYGSEVAAAFFDVGKGLIQEGKGRFRSPTNVAESALDSTGRGVADLWTAFSSVGERFESGPLRGQSKFANKFTEGLVKSGIGIGAITGKLPGSPIRIAAGFGERIFETDYAFYWKERSRLNKLDKEGKLDDVDQERLGLIEMAMTISNMAHLAAEKGHATREVANSVISDQMASLGINLSKLDSEVVKSTKVSRSEAEAKAKSKEEALAPFWKEHGDDVLQFNILRKEIGAANRAMDQLPRGRRRVFLRDNPDQAQLIRLKPRMDEINKQLNVIRKQLANPGMSESRRATLNRSAARLLARAQQLRP